LVREVGFSCCASCYGGVNSPDADPYDLNRIGIAEWFDTPDQFGFEVVTNRTERAARSMSRAYWAVTSFLPPVRSTVPLRRGSAAAGKARLSGLFPGYSVQLYDSGTAALATALIDARARHRSTQPEAILPAYGCPQLVSACLYANVRPCVVDTAPGKWGYALESLRSALTPDTVAIVAANLLGTGDQAADLLPLARGNGSYLIQDSAQHLPSAAPATWCADYVVLSFGRGKPLNLLRGGALAVPDQQPLLVDAPPMEGLRDLLKELAFASRAAAAAFNVVTHPRVYGFATRAPGLGLGETRYSPVGRIARLPPSAWRQVGAGYEKYRREPYTFPWSTVLPEWEQLGVHELVCATVAPPCADRRLRLALLASGRDLRDRIVAALRHRGLGASNMYGSAIDAIPAIPPEVSAQGPFPNAGTLAERLFTLPTHASVTSDIVRQTRECLCAIV
jgi:DegT/DnrJ/EryC1/StrS aminotransferase family